MPVTKKSGALDSTERGKSYLDRLSKSKGRRLVIDLDESGKDALEKLLNTGYGMSQKEVVTKALIFSASHFGVPREKLVIYNVKNDILATSYKAHYASKAYPAQNLIPNVAAPVNISSTKPDQAIPLNQSMSFMQAQIRINQLDYSVGKPDGVFGNRSVEKLKLFQKSRGISMSGALDAQTVEALAAP